MSIHKRKIVLSFNGEIYNYKSLRQELKKIGYKFKTTSDTEVLANAWDRWEKISLKNQRCLYLLFMKKTKKLFIARDIPGEKPLYYIRKIIVCILHQKQKR